MAQRDNRTCEICSKTYRSNDVRRKTCGEKPCVKAFQAGPEKEAKKRHQQARSVFRRPENYGPAHHRWAARIIASDTAQHSPEEQRFAAATIRERQEQFDPRLLEWAEAFQAE